MIVCSPSLLRLHSLLRLQSFTILPVITRRGRGIPSLVTHIQIAAAVAAAAACLRGRTLTPRRFTPLPCAAPLQKFARVGALGVA